MAELTGRNEGRRYEIEKKKYKRRLVIIIAVCIIAVVLVFAFILNSFFNKDYLGYKTITTIKRADSNTVQYLSYKGGLLKFSRDGAAAMNGTGEVVWNGSYDMNSPEADICGDYVVIADIGGKEAYVYNGKDSGTKIETVLPILQAQVADQGVVALLLQDTDSNTITIQYPYDSSNQTEKVNLPTNTSTDGFPIDISLSDDGQKLATSYLYINNGVKKNKVSFYNFGAAGQNKVNRLVGCKDYGQTLVPKIQFVNNNTVCVYGENFFSIFSNTDRPKQIYMKKFKKSIKSIFSNSSYVGFIFENYKSNNKYTVSVYDLKGKQVLNAPINYDYSKVSISGKEIIFYSDLECTIMRLNGNEKFHYMFDRNVEYFIPTNDFDKYFVINDTNIEKIRLTEGTKR
jgi:hypothetical protein